MDMDTVTTVPRIIQGGMGIAVSNWRLANAVARAGQLGVVSATALDAVFVRRLQDGDEGGHLRRAMAQYPFPEVVADILQRFFLPEGRRGTPYKDLPMYRLNGPAERERVTILAAFVEVFLAREGHSGQVGINLLTKIQLPTLASLYGAMLAGVNVVLMGAGIPKDVPAALDAFAEHRPASLRFEVEGQLPDVTDRMHFNPADHFAVSPPPLQRPLFFPIISSSSLAIMLARKASGRVDGFIIEGPTAGGHNAPPRGDMTFNDKGEPIYGERDVVDLDKVKALGLPFWLAGGVGRPGYLVEALDAGAAGIQVGTLFAFCDESGFTTEIKSSVLSHVLRGEAEVFTDAHASPTGFPFKVVRWADDPAKGVERERVCDLGYLRSAYRTPEGKMGYRCASEPIDAYIKKGGTAEEAEGRKCLCNALLADIGHAQVRGDTVEQPLITSGDDLIQLGALLRGRTHYSAADVLDYLLAPDEPVRR